MFIATIINFLLASVYTGNAVAAFIVFIRRVLILNIDYTLSEKRVSVNYALQKTGIVALWAVGFPVSIKPLLPDTGSIHGRWR